MSFQGPGARPGGDWPSAGRLASAEDRLAAVLRAVGSLLLALGSDSPAVAAEPAPFPPAPAASPMPERSAASRRGDRWDEDERVELVLEDARERAHHIIDQSVVEAQGLLGRRRDEERIVRSAVSSLTDEMESLRSRLDRIEDLLHALADRPAAPAGPRSAPPAPPPPLSTMPPQAAYDPLPADVAPPATEHVPSPATEHVPSPATEHVPSPAPERDPAPVSPAPDGTPAAVQFFPEAGPVMLLVSPVAGFQGLMQLQDALTHIASVREATVDGYAQGEARLRLQLSGPITPIAVASGLAGQLERQAHVLVASPEERIIRVELR